MTLSRRHFLSAAPAAALAACGRRGAGFQGVALVAASGSRSVAIVDLLAFARRGSILLPAAPIRLLAHHDASRRTAYAVMASPPSIAELSAESKTLRRTLRLAAEPAAVRISGDTLYWTAKDRNWLGAVDLKSWSSGRTVALASQPVDLDLSPVDPHLAAVSLASGGVQFVDTKAAKPGPAIDADSGLRTIRFRSDGACLLAAEPDNRRITIIDTAARRVAVRLPLALQPEKFRTKRDGGQLFVTGPGLDGVAIVYPYRTEVAQTFLSGRRPSDMADSVNPDYLFVSNPEAGSVTVFDISTQKVVAVTGVGAEPGPIAITPDQQYALVLNQGSGDVAVIRIAAITPGREKRAPLFSMIPAGERPCGITIFSS